MVKLKDIPSQDGMRIQSVTDFFPPWKQTKTNKKEGKGFENGEVIEFTKEITNDDGNTDIKINRTEEATKTSKAYTEPPEEKDEGEDEGADKKTENNQSTNGIGDEADDENKNKNKNKNKIKIKIRIIKKSISTKERRR